MRYLHSEDGANKGAAPFGAGILGGDGGRQGVVTANAKSEEEAPNAQLADNSAGMRQAESLGIRVRGGGCGV